MTAAERPSRSTGRATSPEQSAFRFIGLLGGPALDEGLRTAASQVEPLLRSRGHLSSRDLSGRYSLIDDAPSRGAKASIDIESECRR